MSNTPLMQQYREVKGATPKRWCCSASATSSSCLRRTRKQASAWLGLTLTSRDKGVPMAGFPHHALDAHVCKLVRAGCSVAVCDQVEDPASTQGLVRREVVRVVTPGTVTDEELLDPRRANHLAAVWPQGERVGLAWADLSTGAVPGCRRGLASGWPTS